MRLNLGYADWLDAALASRCPPSTCWHHAELPELPTQSHVLIILPSNANLTASDYLDLDAIGCQIRCLVLQMVNEISQHRVYSRCRVIAKADVAHRGYCLDSKFEDIWPIHVNISKWPIIRSVLLALCLQALPTEQSLQCGWHLSSLLYISSVFPQAWSLFYSRFCLKHSNRSNLNRNMASSTFWVQS